VGSLSRTGQLGGLPVRVQVSPRRTGEALYSARFGAVLLFSVLLTYVATFRSFGFDMQETIAQYPNVAEGWGLWSWLADRMDFTAFFFIVNLILALTIGLLTFPNLRQGHSICRVVQATVLLYMSLWFLFGQARYGTAIGLVVCAMGCESVPIAIALFALAVFIHKAIAGGIILLLAWLALKRTKHGLWIALALSSAVTYTITRVATELLQLSGYGNYLNWEDLPTSNTPYKYLCFGVVLAGWMWLAKDKKDVEERNVAKEMLILAVLFFPFSLYLAFAGRSYQLFAVVVLTILTHKSVPFLVRYSMAGLCFFDLYLLLFRSGCFAAAGCAGP
jgi:hypothetical protein